MKMKLCVMVALAICVTCGLFGSFNTAVASSISEMIRVSGDDQPGAIDNKSTSMASMKGEVYYLACNLHADPRNNKLSSVNYHLGGGLVPLGAEVKVVDISKWAAILLDQKTGIKYKYESHRRTRNIIPLDEHLKKILVDKSKLESIKQEIKTLSDIDQQGIKEGRVKKRMSKRGTLLAIGYPPEFVTPHPMETSKWNYWYNRWKQFFVEFDANGKVVSTKGYPF